MLDEVFRRVICFSLSRNFNNGMEYRNDFWLNMRLEQFSSECFSNSLVKRSDSLDVQRIAVLGDQLRKNGQIKEKPDDSVNTN